jgi:membrane-associated phospholipid phosphatase
MSSIKNYVYHPEFSWARLVSDVVSPPIVWAIMVIPVALQYSSTARQALGWAALYGVFVSLLPILFIAVMVKKGKIGDIHMKERRERYLPLLVSITCTLFVCVLLRWLNAPPVLSLLAIISVVNISVIAIVTLMWQISMHAMSIASAVVASAVLFGVGLALVLVPLVPLVGAARLRLKRHTPAQIIAGTLVGALAPVVVLMLLART